MAGEDTKKKAAVAGLASILLVAAVVAVAVGSSKGGTEDKDDNGGDVVTSTKAVEAICAPTSYKETCVESLANANTTDSKQLVEMAINATIAKVGNVLKNSTLLRDAANDPQTKGAYKVCEEVLDRAVADLHRSVDKFKTFDFSMADEFVGDIRTWLSAVIANQDTCVDAFQNTTGDTGEKMRKMLKKAGEMASNGLAMITDLSSILGQFQLDSLGLNSRRLLGEEDDAFVNRRLLQAKILAMKPTIVVAQDGSGQFKTINDAIKTLKPGNKEFTVIKVKAGVYKEYVTIPKGMDKIVFVGDGPEATKITGDKSMGGGVQTFHTATFAVNADDFLAKDIGFENTAGPKGYQALALRISGDRAVVSNARVDGYQDTLCADIYRQFYRDCTFTGTIDFVFGVGLALFQNCKFIVRKPDPGQECAVTAHGRNDENSNSGFVIQNGVISADPELAKAKQPVKTYLARPWKKLSRNIVMFSTLESVIDPAGYAPCIPGVGEDTCFYGEYQNKGPGANTDGRVKWKGIRKMTPEIAAQWTGGTMYAGDQWVVDSGVVYAPKFMDA